MFKITKFSSITGLTIRTLQYYDEIGLLVPNRETNGHRTYSYNDLVIVNEIILLKDIGFKLEWITKHFSEKKQTDLRASLLLQKKILADKMHEIENQLNNLDWLIESSENGHTLQETAIKKVFIENNPLKDKAALIWEMDLNDKNNLEYLKDYNGTIVFDNYFKKIAKLQSYLVSDSRIQSEIAKFVAHMKNNYGNTFRSDSIPTLATLYIENQEAKEHLAQYGQGFNKFLFDALIYFSKNNIS